MFFPGATLRVSLNSEPVNDLVSGFKLLLTCIVDGGAESINWLVRSHRLYNIFILWSFSELFDLRTPLKWFLISCPFKLIPITRYKNNRALTSYTKVAEEKVQSNTELTKRLEVSLVVYNDEDVTITDKFKCQGDISDAEYPEAFKFNSSDVAQRVFPAKAIRDLTSGHAYEGYQHQLFCQFPDSDVETGYDVLWKFNQHVRGTNIDLRMCLL